MTHEQIIQTLESVYKALETINQSPTWKRLSTHDAADAELSTDICDALHYVGEMLGKLGEMQERQQKITRKYRIFNERITRIK